MKKAVRWASAIAVVVFLCMPLGTSRVSAGEIVLKSGKTIGRTVEVLRIRKWVRVLADSLLMDKFPHYLRMSEIDWQRTFDANETADPEFYESLKEIADDAGDFQEQQSSGDDEEDG